MRTYSVRLLLIAFLALPSMAVGQMGQLLSPANASAGIDIPVIFDWTDGTANTWLLEVATDVGFGVQVLSEVVDTSRHTASELQPNTTYFWHVRYGLISGGVTTWGDYTATRSFRTLPDACCLGNRGNCDGDVSDGVDIADLTALVNFLFIDFQAPACSEEANIDGSGGIDIADLTAMIDNLFINFTALPACPSLIRILNLHPGDAIVRGNASILSPAVNKVVLWAKTDKWYVQPSVASPYTTVSPTGSWSNSTYPWTRMVALLVDSSYAPGATRDYHPSMDPGVIGFDEYPGASIRYVNWSGFRWWVKTGDLVGPGPNYFSNDTQNVWIDPSNRLHLKIDYRNNRWNCAEVMLDRPLGYGIYTFKVDSRIDSLDYNTIFAGFVYETLDREFDMEFSQRLASPFNAQYVAQPWYTPGNITFYNMPTSAQSTHRIVWRADHIIFTSWSGHADAPAPATLINTWTYTGASIPPPGDGRMIFNLYLYGGEAPVQGVENEAVITSFEYAN